MCHNVLPTLLCVFKVCTDGGVTYIIDEIIAEGYLNIANLMKTCENLFLKTTQQNSVFSLWICVLKFFQVVASLALLAK